MATSLTPVSSPFAVFRNCSFALMWMGQLVSTAGSALTSFAASILIFRLTGSALSVGLMLMATAVPTLLVDLIASVFVDRYDRQLDDSHQQLWLHGHWIRGLGPDPQGSPGLDCAGVCDLGVSRYDHHPAWRHGRRCVFRPVGTRRGGNRD